MNEQISLTKAKARLPELVSRADTQHERIVITRDGKPAAILPCINDEAPECLPLGGFATHYRL